MGLTVELGGDPESIRAVARWLREDVAGRLDASIDEIRRICDQSGRVWCDTAGLSFMSRLEDGGRATYRLLTRIERLASLLEECADGLQRAKDLVRQAGWAIDAHRLVVRDGWVFRPSPGDPENDPPHPSAQVSREAIWESRLEAYALVEKLMEQAAQIVLTLLRKLGKVGEDDWTDLAFAAGDFAVTGTDELVKWFKNRALKEADLRATWRAEWLAQADQYMDSTWQSEFYRQQAQRQHWAGLAARNAAENWRLTSRVLGGVGWLITPAGIAYDIYTGDPPDRAVFVGGVSILPGLALAAIPVGGWLAVALTAAGAALGVPAGKIAGQWYDDGQSARVKLIRELGILSQED
jgi:hypothetical protein